MPIARRTASALIIEACFGWTKTALWVDALVELRSWLGRGDVRCLCEQSAVEILNAPRNNGFSPRVRDEGRAKDEELWGVFFVNDLENEEKSGTDLVSMHRCTVVDF